MNVRTYLRLLDELDISRFGAGVLFGYSGRTGQRWAVNGPPDEIAALLLLADGSRAKLVQFLERARHV